MVGNKLDYIPSLELTELASRIKNGKNIGKYHILLSGMVGYSPIKNKRFEKYEGENGLKILDKCFEELGKQ
jgi:hypothetical protein